jgi:hypothetical protein
VGLSEGFPITSSYARPTQSPCSRTVAGDYSLNHYGISIYWESNYCAESRVWASVLHDIDTFLHRPYTFFERANRLSAQGLVVEKKSPAIAGLLVFYRTSARGALVVATPAPVTRTREHKHPSAEQRHAGGLGSGSGGRGAIVIIVVLAIAIVVLLVMVLFFIKRLRKRIH